MKTILSSFMPSLWLLLALSGALFGQDDPDQSAIVVRSAPVGPAQNLAAGKDFDCEILERAHAALINGCFTARREFEATINEKLAMRELTQLDYIAGKLDIEVIEKEHPNKGIQIGGEGDMVIDFIFSCDHMTRIDADRYELQSADEPEQIIFDYDAGNGVLLPLRWEFEQKARFLFKKYHIQAHADYSDVIFDMCETALDQDQNREN